MPSSLARDIQKGLSGRLQSCEAQYVSREATPPPGLQCLRSPKSFKRRLCNSEKEKTDEGEKGIGGEKTKKKKLAHSSHKGRRERERTSKQLQSRSDPRGIV